MRKLIKSGGVALFLGLSWAHAQTTFDYQTALNSGVNDASNNPVGDNQMVLLIANESGISGFDTLTSGSLTAGSFLDGSYQILDTTGTFNFGTPGAFAGTVTLNYTGTYAGLQAGEQLAVVWFTDTSSNSTSVGDGANYGLYTTNSWVVTSDATSNTIELTVPANQDATMETAELSAVPEPSTYALLAGGAALLFAAWHRRQRRGSNLA